MKLKAKKHFIFGSYAGAIYYSWLILLFFITGIFYSESTKGINPLTFVFLGLFVVLTIYTLIFSYVQKIDESTYRVKLPYKKSFTVKAADVKQKTVFKKMTRFSFATNQKQEYKFYLLKGKK